MFALYLLLLVHAKRMTVSLTLLSHCYFYRSGWLKTQNVDAEKLYQEVTSLFTLWAKSAVSFVLHFGNYITTFYCTTNYILLLISTVCSNVQWEFEGWGLERGRGGFLEV